MELFIPFFFFRFLQAFQNGKHAFQGFLQDSFVLSQFVLFYSLYPRPVFIALWFFLSLYQMIGWYLDSYLGIPLTRDLWKFALQPLSFLDSVKSLRVGKIVAPGILLIGLSLWGLRGEPNRLFWLLILIASTPAFFTKARNPLFAIQKNGFLKRRKSTEANWKFPHEVSSMLDPKYPLLRKTISFLGKKKFEAKLQKPHLIFVILESFRAKNVGCLGAKVPLSPHFDRLAKEGVLFTQFHSLSNLTSCCSIASLFGIPPAPIHGHLGEYAKLPLWGLPKILKEAGYQSALLQGGHVAFDHGPEFFQAQGFETLIGKREIEKVTPGASSSSWGVHDEHLFRYAANWLQQQKEAVFATLFTITNHHPWTLPPDWTPPSDAKGASYLETFAYTDWALNLFIEKLKEKGLLEKSVLFIFGDHGQESRSDHFEINRHLFQENVHVPLLIYAPDRIKPQRIETLSSQIDLVPTVLDLLSLPSTHHSLGKSLLRDLPPSPIFFSHPFDDKIRGARKEQWKLILDESEAALYDLATDPDEKDNLASKEAAKVKELQEEVDLFHSQIAKLYEEKAFCSEREIPPNSLQIEWKDSLEIDDDALEQMGNSHPHLSTLSISHCLLLSDRGFRSFLTGCPHLEKLTLEGLDEISGENWPPAPYLMQLKATNCSQFRADWIQNLPALRILQLDLENFSDADLNQIETSQLWALQFTGMGQITDKGLKPILERNPHLTTISIEHCPQITDASLESLQGRVLCQLSFAGLPLLTDKGLEALGKLPLQHLVIQNCPQITGRGLRALQSKGTKVHLFQCPQIDPKEIDSLDLKIWWDQRELLSC